MTIPNPTNATNIGNFSASAPIAVGSDKTKREVIVEWHVEVWATNGGDTAFTLAPNTIGFHDDEGVIDDLTAVQVYDVIGAVTVRKGVALGYRACTSDCDHPLTALVYSSSCIERTGSGNDTEFDHYSGASVRGYTFCCSGGTTNVTFTGANGTTSCSGQNIESTWNGAQGAGLQ